MRIALKILVGILIIFIAGYIWLLKNPGMFYPSQQTIRETENRALLENNPSLCNTLAINGMGNTPREECYMTVALATKDTKVCYEHSYEYSKEKGGPSLVKCYTAIALKYKDVLVCDELRDFRKDLFVDHDRFSYQRALIQCYWSVGEATSDFSVCNRIPDNDARIKCLVHAPGATSKLCDGMVDPSQKEECFTSFGT